jgi:hypothetical protein
VSCIRKQGEGPRDDAACEFDPHEAAGEERRDPNPVLVLFIAMVIMPVRMIMRMIVVVFGVGVCMIVRHVAHLGATHPKSK